MDIPPPATPDEVAAGFPVPLMTLVAQNSVEEAFVSLTTIHAICRNSATNLALGSPVSQSPRFRSG